MHDWKITDERNLVTLLFYAASRSCVLSTVLYEYMMMMINSQGWNLADWKMTDCKLLTYMELDCDT